MHSDAAASFLMASKIWPPELLLTLGHLGPWTPLDPWGALGPHYIYLDTSGKLSWTTLGSPLYPFTAFDPFENPCHLPPLTPSGPGGKSITKDLPLPLGQVDNGVL